MKIEFTLRPEQLEGLGPLDPTVPPVAVVHGERGGLILFQDAQPRSKALVFAILAGAMVGLLETEPSPSTEPRIDALRAALKGLEGLQP